MRTASSNPFDEYLGRNFIKMDSYEHGNDRSDLASTWTPEQLERLQHDARTKKSRTTGSFNQFRENSGRISIHALKIQLVS